MSDAKKTVVVCGGFDDIRSDDVRFLEEASRLGQLHVQLYSDEAVRFATGKEPKFPVEERLYFLEAVRYVDGVEILDTPPGDGEIPSIRDASSDIWVVRDRDASIEQRKCSENRGVEYRVLGPADLEGFPEVELTVPSGAEKRRVMVTGCYDWFHSGHVRFFEECSELGDLYVVVGHDANLRLLKGPGHPTFSEQHRRYMVGSIRYVKQALISTGHGWLDAEPELKRLRPDMYVVNEDGDKPEKRQYCEGNGIEYVVLKRLPRPGLPRRESTKLRGF